MIVGSNGLDTVYFHVTIMQIIWQYEKHCSIDNLTDFLGRTGSGHSEERSLLPRLLLLLVMFVDYLRKCAPPVWTAEQHLQKNEHESIFL